MVVIFLTIPDFFSCAGSWFTSKEDTISSKKSPEWLLSILELIDIVCFVIGEVLGVVCVVLTFVYCICENMVNIW